MSKSTAITNMVLANDYPEADPKEDVHVNGSIPLRYRGTAADQRDMALLGKEQVLRVSSMLGQR